MGALQPAVVQFGLDQPLQVALREVPIPEIGPADVLLAVGAASVCGSDVHQAYLTHSWPVNAPVTLGHEFGGVVAQLGRDVKGFKEGDRVVSETAAYICGECLLCRTGRYNLCPMRKGFGYGIDGAMAQYVRVPARCLHHIPVSLPFDLANQLKEGHAVEGATYDDARPVLRAVTENVLLEIQKTFDFFKATASAERVTRIVLSGGASRAEGFTEMLAERFEAPVEPFDPFKRVQFDAKKFNANPADVGPTAAVAVGLALRRAGDR